MITSRVMSVPSSAHSRRVANLSISPRQADFADPLGYTPAACVLTDAAQSSSGQLPILVAADRRHGRT